MSSDWEWPAVRKIKPSFIKRPCVEMGVQLIDIHPLSSLSVRRIRLSQPSNIWLDKIPNDSEAIIHILSGSLSGVIQGNWGKRTLINLGGRSNIFKELSHTIVLRPGSTFEISPTSRYLDLLEVLSNQVRIGPDLPTVLHPCDWQVHQIGDGHLYRQVREIIGGHGITERLRFGETINETGGTSSFPHHEFASDPERAPHFEEIFLFFANPKLGWGVCRRKGLFCDNTPIDDVQLVRSGDYAVMPLGEHPIISGPESQLAYVWCYVSDVPKRYAKWAEDLGQYA